MSRSLKFATAVAGSLRGGVVIPLESFFKVAGLLDFGADYAQVTLFIPKYFKDLKLQPPLVQCAEPWMKYGAEWHNGPALCWVLPQEWKDAMCWKGKSADLVITEGKLWLLNNVRSLLSRHYVAHLEGLDSWDPSWDFWDHAESGVIQYEREQKARKRT